MAIRLSSVAERMAGVIAVTGGDPLVDDVTHDSRDAGTGVVFVAIRGSRHDGHGFIPAAVEAGASAVVVETPDDYGVPTIVVEDARAAMAHAANAVHGAPDRVLSVVGVTGTNGKTTIVHLCESVWRAIGVRAGIIGTLGARFDGEPIDIGHTTPESSDLQRLLAQMRDVGVSDVAMEVSSHALDLHRADAIHFVSVGFTNLTRDHLDFHGTMDAYFASKARLFDSDRADRGVVNIDDPYGRRLVENATIPMTTASIERRDADIRASDVVDTPEGTTFELVTPSGVASVRLPLVGRFNVQNALVAAGLLIDAGCDVDSIERGFADLRGVRGRMERVEGDHPFSVFVDYAHTPDAVGEVVRSVRILAEGRVIAVVGAGGDRDQDKRALMGAAAARSADVTIVTTDNPRSEDPAVIAAEVERGALAVGRSDVRIILDRTDAITAAIGDARPGDVVMILGKGHEAGQEVAGVILPFDDVQVASTALALRSGR